MGSWKHIGILLLFVSVAPSCTTMKAYEGPELPRDKVAIITEVSGYAPHQHIIVAIDYKKKDPFVSYIAVKPGKHTVTVHLRGGCITMGNYTHCDYTAESFLQFEAEANHTYVVQGENFRNPRYWIVDKESQQRVAVWKE